MRLVFHGWRIALLRSLEAVAVVLICLLLLLATTAVLLPNASVPDPVKIAVICPEDSPMAAALISSMAASRFDGLATLDVISVTDTAADYAAVLTLPEGFWESIMTGENLSPSLVINVSSPLEGLWVRQLAESSARTLTQAQNATGALIAAYQAEGLSYNEISAKLFDANLTFINGFLDRKGHFKSEILSPTGSVSAAQYYGSSVIAFLLFALLFLFFTPLHALRRFAAFSQRRTETFIACLLTAFTLSLPLSVLGALALKAEFKNFAYLLLLTLLVAAILTLCATAFKSPATCAAAISGLALLQALFGGGILPESLLPPSLGTLCHVLPLSLMRKLLASAAFSVRFTDYASVLIWCALLIGAAYLLWNRKEVA